MQTGCVYWLLQACCRQSGSGRQEGALTGWRAAAGVDEGSGLKKKKEQPKQNRNRIADTENERSPVGRMEGWVNKV